MLERSIWCHKASVQVTLSPAKYWNSGRKLSLLYITRKQNPCVLKAGSTLQTIETLSSNNFSPLVGLRSSETSHVRRTPAQTSQPTPVAHLLTAILLISKQKLSLHLSNYTTVRSVWHCLPFSCDSQPMKP